MSLVNSNDDIYIVFKHIIYNIIDNAPVYWRGSYNMKLFGFINNMRRLSRYWNKYMTYERVLGIIRLRYKNRHDKEYQSYMLKKRVIMSDTLLRELNRYLTTHQRHVMCVVMAKTFVFHYVEERDYMYNEFKKSEIFLENIGNLVSTQYFPHFSPDAAKFALANLKLNKDQISAIRDIVHRNAILYSPAFMSEFRSRIG